MKRALLILLLCAAQAALAATPQEIDEAAAHAHNGLRTVVKKLASNKMAGRDNGTAGSLKAQAYLIRKLRRLGPGLAGGGTDDASYQQAITFGEQTGTNLLAVIPGTDLAEEYVMIGAHYDHLDSRSNDSGGCAAAAEPGGEICNGAADNASGVAATLAIAKAAKKLAPRRSLILAFWDGEEDGLAGSAYYRAHPLVPHAAVKAYINFDIQGADLLPSLKNVSFAVGTETGGSPFGAMVDAAVRAEGLDTQLLSYLFGQLRSDYVNLVAAGIPTVFFSDANNGCYHTVNDDVKYVDFKKLKRQAHAGFRTAMALAETDTPPAFGPPNPNGASFSDLERVAGIVAKGRPDLALLTPADQTLVQDVDDTLQALVADGPAAFGPEDVGTLLGAAIQTVDALRRVPCQKF